MAKSNRLSNALIREKTKKPRPANDFVVGARFIVGEKQKRKHVITYYINEAIIDHMTDIFQRSISIIDDCFNGIINNEKLNQLNQKTLIAAGQAISPSVFRQAVVDASYIELFSIPNNKSEADGHSIITIYKTDSKIEEIARKTGVNLLPGAILNQTTLLLSPDQALVLQEKAPYLIAMANQNETKPSHNQDRRPVALKRTMTIPEPNNEPVVGVIDTMFDQAVYFSKWVEFQRMIGDQIPLDDRDYEHGTAVSSIIVDGPSLNPNLDDGCGRFRVKHFGVSGDNIYSASEIMKNIELVVASNPQIKVWNLSLGSSRAINLNSISPEAAKLDQIQSENDVIFVVAGTNKQKESGEERIGSPADSINSLVVNSVNKNGQPASYSRKGLVLSFFNKPDVSSYGGDDVSGADFIRCQTRAGEIKFSGTSFAAPWVTRKLAYLIEVLGLSREAAKALVIDAASGWEDKANQPLAALVGHGVVPTRIDDIVQSANDEIKFVINDIAQKYDTFTYNLPVPQSKNKYPFIAKATLCYFPQCSINQGVDYTNTEIDIYLGRIKMNERSNRPEILSINKNKQSPPNSSAVYEIDARSHYRKWDNVKHICEIPKAKQRARIVYGQGNRMWGISLKTKERLTTRSGPGIKFGLVVTLKEITGANRIDDFIRHCLFSGWLVNRINIETQVNVYNQAQAEIQFDQPDS